MQSSLAASRLTKWHIARSPLAASRLTNWHMGNSNLDKFLRKFRGMGDGLRDYCASERGSVESALTLIPLMILFLTVAQVGISVYSRSVSDQSTQGAVAYAAMGSQVSANPGALPLWSSPLIALPLPGGGSVLVGERQRRTPGVTPLLPGGESFTSTGIAVQE